MIALVTALGCKASRSVIGDCPALATQFCKEVTEKLAALICMNPGRNLYPMVESCVTDQFVQRLHAAHLGVGGAIDQFFDPCIYQGPSAHGAWFKRDGQTATIQPPRSNTFGRVTQSKDFCVCSWVGTRLTGVVGFCQNRIATVNHRANRDLIVFHRFGRQLQRSGHHFLVDGHCHCQQATLAGDEDHLRAR